MVRSSSLFVVPVLLLEVVPVFSAPAIIYNAVMECMARARSLTYDGAGVVFCPVAEDGYARAFG